jgi:hypothetical protein
MGTQVIATEAEPATPSAGFIVHWMDNQGLIPCYKNSNGDVFGRSENASVANQSPGTSDAYLTNSNVLIPSFGFKAKSCFRWRFSASKTAAGLAQPAIQLRIGAAASTADTSRLTLTMRPQTAVLDVGTLNVMVTCRNAGAAAVLQGTAWWDHRGTITSSTGGTGFADDGTGHVEATSAAFDAQGSTIGGLNVGLSINCGASAAWTVTQGRIEVRW